MKAGQKVLTIVMTSLLAVAQCHADQTTPTGSATTRPRLYNTSTVQTVEGTITNVQTFKPERRPTGRVHVTVKTTSGDIDVRVGPETFLQKIGLQLNNNDKITITGSVITLDGRKILIASEIKKDNQSFKLRNTDGTPLWPKLGRVGMEQGPEQDPEQE